MGTTVVIGAGVIGLASAYELLKRGVDVHVLDRVPAGSACSLGNAGWIVPAMSAPIPAPGIVGTSLKWMLRRDSPLYIRPRSDPAFARWLWAFWRNCRASIYETGLQAVARLNAQTMHLFDRWREEGLPFEMQQSGLLFVGMTDRAIDAALCEIHHLEPFGYARPVRLTARDMRVEEPLVSESVAGGFLLPDERLVRPETLTAALEAAILRMGGRISTDADVVAIRRSGGRPIAVQTRTGDVPCDDLLIAAGAWSGDVTRMLGVTLPVEAGKGYSITIDNPDRMPTRPLDLIEARVACTPFAGALRLAGTMELSGQNLRLEPRRVTAIRRAGERYLGVMPSGSAEREWVGMRPLTPDGLPIIGPLPGFDNAWIATGHAMLGITLAPATGAAIANIMCSRVVTPELMAFAPHRFVRSH